MEIKGIPEKLEGEEKINEQLKAKKSEIEDKVRKEIEKSFSQLAAVGVANSINVSPIIISDREKLAFQLHYLFR